MGEAGERVKKRSSSPPHRSTIFHFLLIIIMISSLLRPSISLAARSLKPSSTAILSTTRSFSSTLPFKAVSTRFTPEHEWVSFDDQSNVGTVGITDYAQKSLGDVVYVELPSEGSELTQGGEYRTHKVERGWERGEDKRWTRSLSLSLSL